MLAVKSDTVALPPVVDQYNVVAFATLVVVTLNVPDEPSFTLVGVVVNT